MKKLAQGFNTAAQDLNPGCRSRESETLPLSHCALQIYQVQFASDFYAKKAEIKPLLTLEFETHCGVQWHGG